MIEGGNFPFGRITPAEGRLVIRQDIDGKKHSETFESAITGNRKAWLVLEELQDSGKIEIVPYQGGGS